MQYNWDIKKIEVLKRHYIELKKTEGLLEADLIGINENLDLLKQMKNILNNTPETNSEDFPIFLDENKILTKEVYDDFKNIPNFIRQWIIHSFAILKKFKISLPFIDMPQLDLTNEELIMLSHDFFNWLPVKKYVKIVDQYFKKEKNVLHIQSTNTSYSEFLGTTFTFHYPKYQPFFFIPRENTVNDFCTLNHELAHGIYQYYDTSNGKKNNSKYLLELEGYQFDSFSRIFLKEQGIISYKDVQLLEYEEFMALVEMVVSFYMQSLVISNYDATESINLESLKRSLVWNIENEDICEYLLDFPQENAMYILSFLTNLDLENIKDRELAFKEFEAIRFNQTNAIENMLIEHGITFMKDNYQNLYKRVRKMNQIR